jgi:hypothetical protein
MVGLVVLYPDNRLWHFHLEKEIIFLNYLAGSGILSKFVPI